MEFLSVAKTAFLLYNDENKNKKMEALETESRRPKIVLKDFISRHPEFRSDEPTEKIEVADKQSLQDKILDEARISAQAYFETNPPLQKVKYDTRADGTQSLTLPIRERLIDPTIPLSIRMSKTYKFDEDGKRQYEIYGISLFKGNCEKEMLADRGSKNEVATFAIRDNGDEFRLAHRYIPERYRGQGFGPIMLKAIEEFTEAYASATGREPVIDAYCAQLDVHSMFDSAGYESVEDLPREGTYERGARPRVFKLEDILQATDSDDILRKDGKMSDFNIGPWLYVFPKDIPESDYIKYPEHGVEGVNINASAFVHFRKNLKGRESAPTRVNGIEEVSGYTRNELVRTLTGYTFLPENVVAEETRMKVKDLMREKGKGRSIARKIYGGYTKSEIQGANRSRIEGMMNNNLFIDITEDEMLRMLNSEDEATSKKMTDILNKGITIGKKVNGRIVALAGIRAHARMSDGRPIFEITKVVTLGTYQGKGYGSEVMDSAIQKVKDLFPNCPIATASKNPKVVEHFRKMGWKENNWGDGSKMDNLLSGPEPRNNEKEWQSEWRKMRDRGYVNFLYDPQGRYLGE
ncbi:MAG: GNAT family N-acetyltransferase [Candidatus Gracilibacteria bacterium]